MILSINHLAIYFVGSAILFLYGCTILCLVLFSFDLIWFYSKIHKFLVIECIVLVSKGVLVVLGPFANALSMHLFMTCFLFFLSGLHFAFRGSLLSSIVIDHTHALTWAQFE